VGFELADRAGEVNLGTKAWSFRDPCLTTSEVAGLAQWLDQLVDGAALNPYYSFTEPNLQFDRVSDRAIRVSFALECAPPWAERGDRWTKHGFEVPIGPGLRRAAAELRCDLARFPERGRRFD
jgi:hypothetical protein